MTSRKKPDKKIILEIEQVGKVWVAHYPGEEGLKSSPVEYGKTPAKAAYKFLSFHGDEL